MERDEDPDWDDSMSVSDMSNAEKAQRRRAKIRGSTLTTKTAATMAKKSNFIAGTPAAATFAGEIPQAVGHMETAAILMQLSNARYNDPFRAAALPPPDSNRMPVPGGGASVSHAGDRRAPVGHNSGGGGGGGGGGAYSDATSGSGGDSKKRRGNLPKAATVVLKDWLFKHLAHPYPSEEEKEELGGKTDLSVSQISNWFINARRRILQPMLEQAKRTRFDRRDNVVVGVQSIDGVPTVVTALRSVDDQGICLGNVLHAGDVKADPRGGGLTVKLTDTPTSTTDAVTVIEIPVLGGGSGGGGSYVSTTSGRQRTSARATKSRRRHGSNSLSAEKELGAEEDDEELGDDDDDDDDDEQPRASSDAVAELEALVQTNQAIRQEVHDHKRRLQSAQHQQQKQQQKHHHQSSGTKRKRKRKGDDDDDADWCADEEEDEDEDDDVVDDDVDPKGSLDRSGAAPASKQRRVVLTHEKVAAQLEEQRHIRLELLQEQQVLAQQAERHRQLELQKRQVTYDPSTSNTTAAPTAITTSTTTTATLSTEARSAESSEAAPANSKSAATAPDPKTSTQVPLTSTSTEVESGAVKPSATE